jgi:hypothetical protein
MKSFNNPHLIKQLYTRPKVPETQPTYQIYQPNILHECDCLYFSNDGGYKYLLTLIDVHNSLCDARALKNMSGQALQGALDDIYRTSEYLDYPQVLQCDDQFNIKPIKDWADIHEVHLKITEPYEHNQNSHVERLNRYLGQVLWKYQVDREIKTGKVNTQWIDDYKGVIQALNQKRKQRLESDNVNPRKQYDPQSNDTYKMKGEKLIADGTPVRLSLLDPEDLFGKREVGTFRATDPRWRYYKNYRVLYHIDPADGGPMLYQIVDIHNKKFRHLVPSYRLQII